MPERSPCFGGARSAKISGLIASEQYPALAPAKGRTITVDGYLFFDSVTPELEPRLADVLAVAGDAKTDVLMTSTELGVGWGSGS